MIFPFISETTGALIVVDALARRSKIRKFGRERYLSNISFRSFEASGCIFDGVHGRGFRTQPKMRAAKADARRSRKRLRAPAIADKRRIEKPDILERARDPSDGVEALGRRPDPCAIVTAEARLEAEQTTKRCRAQHGAA